MNWKRFISYLVDKAKAKVHKVWAMGMKGGYLSVRGGIKLWKVLINSNLEYGASACVGRCV